MKQDWPSTIAQTELRLLLACARAPNAIADGPSIRRMLEESIDWSLFARKAVRHGLASLVGSTLERIAPDMVPDDLLDALRMNREAIRSRNKIITDGFFQSATALANHGVEAIWFKGPLLGVQSYGQPDLREFGIPTFLIREQTAIAAVAALRDAGYHQKAGLTGSQLDLIRYLQGYEFLSHRSLRVGADVCIRLTPIAMALDIDHEGLWQRARPLPALGLTVQTLAPDDGVLTLAVRNVGSWRLSEACDFASFIASQPGLDWGAIVERARAQGSLRMLQFGTTLARRYFDAKIAGEILLAEGADPIVKALVSRTVAEWQLDQAYGSHRNNGFSVSVLRLHDGSVRKVRYLVRSLFLPATPHVSRIPLPRRFSNLFDYTILKVVQEAVVLPPLRTYRKLRGQVLRLRDLLASHHLGLAIIPVSSEQRLVLRRFNAARSKAERALAQNPNNWEAWQDLGDALFRLARHDAAINAYDKALAHVPEDRTLWQKRNAAIRARGGPTSSLDVGEQSTLDPDSADGWARQAAAFAVSKRFAEAVSAADRALTINPTHQLAMRVGIRSRILSCDWRRSEEDEHRVADAFGAGLALLTPAGNRAICDSEAQNLVAAQLWVRPLTHLTAPQPHSRRYSHDRIRLAYLCSEYHEHPVGRQVVGVFEHHDRTRFDVTAISLGGPNSSAIRRRIEAACDKFISVHDLSDEQVAGTIREMEIDIAIDLDRFAARARPGILARRPAALQVTYFGNAGTTGAPFLDYIVADRTLIPDGHVRYYTEKVLYLPNSYQCNDSKRPVVPSTPTRGEAGLPETGFVYCCFNQNYKIRPAVFDAWMRLLSACPRSVLWLLGGEPHAIHNLRREAVARGITSDRLVFAPFVANDDHIARHKLADLFLDTLPCNAHATASDALWAGLPILTCLGNTFAGRVGASLLRAVGLPEMVTESLPQYETLALSLARDQRQLAAIKAKLARNLLSESLFDTARFTRDLEAAFEVIWRRHQADLAPETIAL